MSSSSMPDDLVVSARQVSKKYDLHNPSGSLRYIIAGLLSTGTRSLQPFWALQNVSFEVHRGEALGVIGPNGAGKTTLLKILSRVTQPTRGQVQVNGRLGPLLELGAGFHPELTGRENIFLYGSILGLRQAELRHQLDAIIHFSGLEAFLDTPVKRYSSGMWVRLAFSVAAHTTPDLLLVDEVLAVGDAEFRQRCIARIQALQGQGASLLFVSHNLAQVRAVCERGLFLLAGRPQALGSVDEAAGAYEAWLRSRASADGVPTEPADPDPLGTGLQLLGVELCRPYGPSLEALNYDEPAEIRLHYAAGTAFTKLHFVLRIYRSDGLLCCLLRSAHFGLQLPPLHGRGRLALPLAALPLTGGQYSLEVRLRDPYDAATLAVGRSPEFTVRAPDGWGSGGVFYPRLGPPQLLSEERAPAGG